MASEIFTISKIQQNVNEFLSGVPGLTEETKKKQIKSLEYICQLAALTNTSLRNWNIPGLFGTGNGNELLTDKHDINKRMFERISTKIETTTAAEADVMGDIDKMPELLAAVNKYSENLLANKKQTLQRKLEQKAVDLKSQMQYVDDYIKQLNEIRKELNLITGRSESEIMKRELAESLKDGSWVNPVVKDNFLFLNTKNNVVISYKNKAAKVDIDLNCGQLAVKVDLNTLNMYVIPYKNNIKSGEYFHPHIDCYEGNICWGDARNQVVQWMKDGKLSSMLKMLYSLLFNYNDGNPYISIQQLKEHGTKYGRCSAWNLHPDKEKKKVEKKEVVKAVSTDNTPVAATTGAIPTNLPNRVTYPGTDMPIFEVGDQVECEASINDPSQPRWNGQTDSNSGERGSRILHGTVTRVEGGSIASICTSFSDGARNWYWSTRGLDYQPDQWNYPGYLRHSAVAVVADGELGERAGNEYDEDDSSDVPF